MTAPNENNSNLETIMRIFSFSVLLVALAALCVNSVVGAPATPLRSKRPELQSANGTKDAVVRDAKKKKKDTTKKNSGGLIDPFGDDSALPGSTGPGSGGGSVGG